jgi:hypothetical protein
MSPSKDRIDPNRGFPPELGKIDAPIKNHIHPNA